MENEKEKYHYAQDSKSVAPGREGLQRHSFDLDDNLVSALKEAKPDVVFIVLHGVWGRRMPSGSFDILGFPYVDPGFCQP